MKKIRSEMLCDNMKLRAFVYKLHQMAGRATGIEHMIKSGYFDGRSTVVTGIRNIDEIERAKEMVVWYQVHSIYLKAPFCVRLKRTLCRGERNALTEFFIEEWYSMKWGDRCVRGASGVVSSLGTPRGVAAEVARLVSSL